MIKLAFADLRDHILVWVGAFAVALACGYVGGWVASLAASASTCESLRDLGWVVLVFSAIAAMAVIVSVANLTVAAQRRSYALWRLANVDPRLVSLVVLVQLAAVAVLGAACGTLIESVTFVPLFPWVFDSPNYRSIDQAALDVGVSLMPLVWLAVVGAFLVGGSKGARLAGKTEPIVILREREAKGRGMTWVRGALFVGVLVGICRLSAFMAEADPGAVVSSSLYPPILIMTLLAVAAPLMLPALMRAWTAIVPQRCGGVWQLARRFACYGLAASVSIETPIMVGFGFAASIFSLSGLLGIYAQQQDMADLSTSLDWTSSVLLLGGPVLLCSVGAAAGVVMSSRSRARDVAVLSVSGVGSAALLAAAAWEAFIHAVNATLLGMLAVLASEAIVANAAGLSLFDGLAFTEGLVVSVVGFGLVLVSTLVPTCIALRRRTFSAFRTQG